MKPPADLPLELVLLAEAFARRLEMPPGDFWAVVYRKKPPPPGWAAAWADAFAPLTSVGENGTIRTMSTAEIEAPRRGRPTEVKHPLFQALAKAGVTIAEEAKAVKRSPASIRSFCYDDENRRPAPEALRQRWLEKYGVPLKVWR